MGTSDSQTMESSHTNHWIRMRLMNENRINAKLLRLAEYKSGRGCKNWNFPIKQSFEEANIHVHFDDRIGDGHHLKVRMFTHLFEKIKNYSCTLTEILQEVTLMETS